MVDKPAKRSVGIATTTVVVAITSAGFLFRTTGIHWDELMYLQWRRTGPSATVPED